MKILTFIVIIAACVVAGCSSQEKETSDLPAPINQQSEYEIGPADAETSVAAKLAENFMKTQSDRKQYSVHATGVLQEEAGVYIVRFGSPGNSPDSAALVSVILDEKRCERIQIK